MSPTMSSSNVRRSLIRVFSLKRKADSDPISPPRQASVATQFKDLSVCESEMLAVGLCAPRSSMRHNRFETATTDRDRHIVVTRIGRLPKRLVGKTASDERLCRLHRELNYKLIDDVVYIFARTLSKSAAEFRARVEIDNRRLPTDIKAVFDQLDQASEHVKWMCRCLSPAPPLPTLQTRHLSDASESIYSNGEQSMVKRLTMTPATSTGMAVSKASSSTSTPCCPACLLSSLSTNIAFLTAYRAFLLAYIPSKNHGTARRLAFADGWVQKTSPADREAIVQTSQARSKLMIRLLKSASRAARRVRGGRTTAEDKSVSSGPLRPRSRTNNNDNHGYDRTHETRESSKRTVSHRTETPVYDYPPQMPDLDSPAGWSDGGDENGDGDAGENGPTKRRWGFVGHVDEVGPAEEVHSYDCPSLRDGMPSRYSAAEREDGGRRALASTSLVDPSAVVGIGIGIEVGRVVEPDDNDDDDITRFGWHRDQLPAVPVPDMVGFPSQSGFYVADYFAPPNTPLQQSRHRLDSPPYGQDDYLEEDEKHYDERGDGDGYEDDILESPLPSPPPSDYSLNAALGHETGSFQSVAVYDEEAPLDVRSVFDRSVSDHPDLVTDEFDSDETEVSIPDLLADDELGDGIIGAGSTGFDDSIVSTGIIAKAADGRPVDSGDADHHQHSEMDVSIDVGMNGAAQVYGFSNRAFQKSIDDVYQMLYRMEMMHHEMPSVDRNRISRQ